MDIRFYSLSGELKMICADYVRVKWQSCLKSTALSEIVVLSRHPLFNLMEKESVLIVKYGGKQGIVCGYSADNEYLTVKIKSLLNLLERRILMGVYEEDTVTYSGNPLVIIRDKILAFADYIEFSGEIKSVAERTVTFKCGTDLLTASKELLSGTRIGIDIKFEPKAGKFYLGFLYPFEYVIRLSEGNRNLTEVSSALDLTDRKNAGYYALPFLKTVDWNPVTDSGAVKDGYKDNYLKQYRLLSDYKYNGIQLLKGEYLFCDNEEGIFKRSETEKKFIVKYMSKADNPVNVFEADMRKEDELSCSALLELRKNLAERWTAEPLSENLIVGAMVTLEKEIGAEKGLKELQVISVTTDTEKPLPDIELA